MSTKKKLLLHIGFPKTGSSALQSFLSASVDRLAQAGVHYPYPEPRSYVEKGLCSGNVMQLISAMGYVDKARGEIIYDKDFLPLCTRIKDEVMSSPHPCTLISGEVFSQFPEEKVAQIAQLTHSFEVEIIAFVRDPFDFACSSWKQRVKRSGARHDFHQDIEIRYREQSIEMLDGFGRYAKYFGKITLINYDHAKRDVIDAFLTACQLSVDITDKGLGNRVANKSLRASEANLVILINNTLPGSPLGSLFVEYLLRQPPSTPDDYYNSAAHSLLLEHYKDTIAAINMHLPAGEKISDYLRERTDTPPQIELTDLSHLLMFFQQTLDYPADASRLRKLLRKV